MLKVEALVRPERINQVTKALDASGCTGYYYDNVTGQGRQKGVEVITGRGGQISTRSAVPKTRVTTVIHADQLNVVIEAILASARSSDDGQTGDGKIFVTEISDIIRVSSGERGEIAI